MLGAQLRDGITVRAGLRRDVPRIQAYAGELNQVWTNLIDNAVDAMDGAGALRVDVRPTRADVVEIADTGGGMSPEVTAHAFDPFFTTKEVGKYRSGSGYRPAHHRRARHGGVRSTFDQSPGATVIRVRLPL